MINHTQLDSTINFLKARIYLSFRPYSLLKEYYGVGVKKYEESYKATLSSTRMQNEDSDIELRIRKRQLKTMSYLFYGLFAKIEDEDQILIKICSLAAELRLKIHQEMRENPDLFDKEMFDAGLDIDIVEDLNAAYYVSLNDIEASHNQLIANKSIPFP